MATVDSTTPSPAVATLELAALSLLSVRRLARDADDTPDDEQASLYLTAVQELTRAAFRRIDAAIVMLGGAGLGNFNDRAYD
jgi:Asp/Glu/hydantoin racemase